ncbi:hypothetical protein BJX66DRAFT_337015 [Aspergillus keveii]|uniref:Rhodopsin domain-containing protein n=1 Tax=Aspergillus keveii TaxID=714993 RepID=A0ABR4G900_9EURO
MARLPQTLPSAAFWVVFVDSWAYLSIGIPKLGIALMVCRIFRPRRSARLFVMTATIILNILASIGLILSYVQCSPAAGQFDRWKYPETRCWDSRIHLIYACVVSSFSGLTDVGFSIWPAIVIWKLKMSARRRLGAMALMSVGIASSVFAALKLYNNTTLISITEPLPSIGKYT